MPTRSPILRFNRETLVLFVCLAASVTLLALPLTARIAVANQLERLLVKPFVALLAPGQDEMRLRRENARLRAEVTRLELLLADGEGFPGDAPRLSGPAIAPALLGDLVPCRVVMRARQRFVTMLKIESLEDAGWAEWQPVISRAGYLGRIREVVNEREAWVELMTAPDFALGVEFARTGLLGILVPRAGRFVVEMVGRDEDVAIGDVIVTSGVVERDFWNRLDRDTPAVTPPGIPVGVVADLPEPAMGQIFKTIVVKPAARFSHNEPVFVVTPVGSGGVAPR